MSHREKITSSGKSTYVFILSTGVLLAVIILFSLLIGIRINFIFSTLLNSTLEVKVNVAEARFEFLKSQKDTSQQSLQNAWEYLSLAELYANQLLQEKDLITLLSLPFDNTEIKEKVQKIQVLLLDYRGLSSKYFNNKKRNISKSAEQNWEFYFENIILIVNEVENSLRSSVKSEVKTFQYIQFSLIGVGVVFSFLSIYFYSKYGKQKLSYQRRIEDVSGDLEKVIFKKSRIEVEFQETQRKFTTLIQNLPGIVYRCKKEPMWSMEFVSDKCYQITGYQPKDLINNNLISYADLVHSEDQKKILLQIQKAVEERNPYQLIYRIKTASGYERWVWEQGSGIYSEKDDELIAFEGFIIDITEQKAVEDQLYLQSNALEAAANSIVITDKEGRVLWVNSAFTKLTGYTLKELMGLNINVLKSDEQDKSFFEYLWNTIKSGDIWRGEIINKKKDGTLYNEEMTITPIKNSVGEIIYFVAIKQDITERKKAEEALRESEYRFRGLFENATIGIYRTSYSGKILLANPTLIKILGYDSLAELYKLTAENVYVDLNARDEFQKEINTKGKITGFESKWKKRDGTIIYIRESARIVRDDDERPLYYEGAVEDITEKKKVEEALIEAKERAEQSDRLKSEFLSQMSHEIRTPLNVIISFTNMMKEELHGKIDEELNTGLDVIEIEGKRIMRTIELIINMSEVQLGQYNLKLRQIDLYNEVLMKLHKDYSTIADQKKLEFKLVNNTEGAILNADEYSIKQIFNHIIDNAIKFTPKGKVEIIINRDARKKLFVDISDTGIGMSEEFLPLLFTPFTKEEQGYTRNFEGNGLGLALVKRYCDLNNAEIKVVSKKGKGSIFRIIFNRTVN